MKEEKVLVRLQWESVCPDPMQYKPNYPTLKPENIFIEVEVDSKYVIMDKPDQKVITPEGMASICQKLRKAMAQSYQE